MSSTQESHSPRIILVTGSNDGIGYELVRKLAVKGHTVYLSSRNEMAGKKAQAQLKSEHGLDVKYVQLDVTNEQSILNAKDTIEKDEGRLDVLVNNAGISGETALASSVKVISAITSVFDTNFLGLIRATTIFLPLIRKARDIRGFAVILNVTSDLASSTNQSDPMRRIQAPHVPYVLSKTAVNSYTIELAHELKGEGIKVNCLTPGLTNTKLVSHMGGKSVSEGAEGLVPWALLTSEGRTCVFATASGPLPW